MLGLSLIMRSYKLVLVLRPTLKDAELKKLLDNVKDMLKSLKIVKEDDLGQKALSYPIKKEVAGVYVDFSLEGENVPEGFEKRLGANDNIIRHLLIRNK